MFATECDMRDTRDNTVGMGRTNNGHTEENVCDFVLHFLNIKTNDELKNGDNPNNV